jgi:DNA-binding MarR family transcriptional regulator
MGTAPELVRARYLPSSMPSASSPPATELADGLGAFVGHLLQSSNDAFFALAHELDLSLSQLRALCLLAEHDDVPLHELTPGLGLSPQATGRAVDVLVRAGLAMRREDERDRRVKRVALSEEGRVAVRRLDAARRDGLRAFVAALDEDAREALAHALDAMPAPEAKR